MGRPASHILLAVHCRVNAAVAFQRVVSYGCIGVVMTQSGALRSFAVALLVALRHAGAP